MRIAIVNENGSRVGGVETYLETLIPALVQDGVDVAFLGEKAARQDAAAIVSAGEVPMWAAQELGTARALEELAGWGADVVYAHGHLGLELMRGLPGVAPVAFYAHGYYGTCITGAKSFKFPVARSCTKSLGPACLLHYYPHRCGGLNPYVMWKLYREEMARREALRQFRLVLTASAHMHAEYLRHGFHPSMVRTVPYPVVNCGKSGELAWEKPRASSREARLVFVGRMTMLKGGAMLIDAAERLHASTGWQIHVVFVGDGPERRRWERAASAASAANPALEFAFVGWFSPQKIDQLLKSNDLLVVPSLWPEPFGLVGPEAGLNGVPASAFDVGGVGEWLREGVNGHLAPGDPPTAAGLADAIVKCLADPAHYARLRQGAVEVAREFTMKRHLRMLLPILHSAAQGNCAALSPQLPINSDGARIQDAH